MPKLVWTPAAQKDIKELLDYIGVKQEHPAAARTLANRIQKTCELLATQPQMGEPRPHLAEDMRLFPVRPYVIFFFPLGDGVRVARVIHGARDFPRLFGKGEDSEKP